MLKGAVVGRPSIVFTRHHKAEVTRIRDHQFSGPRICKRILGYYANTLYLSTMLRKMSCGKEKFKQYSGSTQAAWHMAQKGA